MGCRNLLSRPNSNHSLEATVYRPLERPQFAHCWKIHRWVSVGVQGERFSSQVRKNSLNIKFLGGIFLGHPGPRRRDIPDKNFMQVAFLRDFAKGVAGTVSLPIFSVFRFFPFSSVSVSEKTGRHRSRDPFCETPIFSAVEIDREWPGCPGIWVGTSRIWKKKLM